MAATSMRIPSKHQAPLKTLNRGSNFLRNHRNSNTAKRKSAVELLQESKAFYVKSETVLDRKQELKNSGHLQVTSSALDTGVFLRGGTPLIKKSAPSPWINRQDNKYIHQHVLLLSPPALPPRPPPATLPAPPLPPKSPRLVSAAQRRSGSHHSAGSDQLQTKLRRLLNADSKENLFFSDTDHKYRRLWDNEDEDIKTVAGDEQPFRRAYTRSISHNQACVRTANNCSVHHKSLPDLHASPPSSATSSPDSSVVGCDVRSASSHWRQSLGSSPRDVMSLVSSGDNTNKSQLIGCRSRSSGGSSGSRNPSTDLVDSQDSGQCDVRRDSGGSFVDKERSLEISLSRRTSNRTQLPADKPGTEVSLESCEHPGGRSGQRDVESTANSDSGAEEVMSPPLLRANEVYGDHRRPILRSKSDISHRYSRGSQPPIVKPPPPPPRSTAQLEKFFEQLGLDAQDFGSLSTPLSGSSTPIYFSSVSSVDSAVAWGAWGCGGIITESGGVNTNTQRPTEQLSIVERNARIIKWLCNCRKAQLTTRKSS